MQPSIYGPEHLALQDSLRKFVDAEINPFVDEWEKAEIFPAHEVYRKMGRLGFLGVHKPQDYGGMGL
jgi:citronellyl-CoA dehydrogenase